MEDGKRKKESKSRKEEEDGGGSLLASVRRCWRWPAVVARLSGLVGTVDGGWS